MRTTEDLTYLSRRAHAEAVAKHDPPPYQWSEFSHLPMWRQDEVPVLDGTRMRQDQIEDAVESLERYLGVKARESDAYTAVEDHVLSYARWGVREQDVVSQTGVSRSSVKRILNRMVSAGMLVVRTEKTRGSGSRRKRFFLSDRFNSPSRDERLLPADMVEDGMVVESLRQPNGDTGIRHHGSAVQALTCGCAACGWAFEEAMVAELRSEARRRGDRSAAFTAGLELRRMRRESADAEFRRMLGAVG